MKTRVYTDTSVIGGYFDDEFQDGSIQLFNEFVNGKKQLVISDLTLKELEFAPINVQELIKKIPQENIEYLILDDEAKLLAEKYIDEGAVSDKFILDAQHIAIATLGHVDVIVSWNFKHIVNLRRIHLYNSTNLKYGYQIIEIRTPKEVLNEE